MRITELIAPCGKMVPLFPGRPSKCLTLNSNQNPPANTQMGCCLIQRDFSHWTFSTKCGHENFLTTWLMKRIDTTMRERIITDDAVSTHSFITLYFNDVINIFTKRYSAQRPLRGTRGCMGPRPGQYPKGTQSMHRVHTSIHFYSSTKTLSSAQYMFINSLAFW